jgi:hypothetical protein
MSGALHRLFLLFLLGCDWAADPALLAPAVQVGAAPLASSLCLCSSSGSQAETLSTCISPRQAASEFLLPTPDFPCPHSPRPKRIHLPSASPGELLYFFQSLRC